MEVLEGELTGPDDPRQADLETLAEQQNGMNSELLERSYLGRFGHAVEPLVKPLGWDWKIGVGVIASFPAREVIISTLGTIYSLGSDVNEESPQLRDELKRSTWPDGSPVFTLPVAVSIMVFFALCAQCVSTLLVIRRETNSWGWAAFTFVYMTGLAYIGALICYQVGTWLMG
jgi:ferrous iron transport protein B